MSTITGLGRKEKTGQKHLLRKKKKLAVRRLRSRRVMKDEWTARDDKERAERKTGTEEEKTNLLGRVGSFLAGGKNQREARSYGSSGP